MFDTIQEKPAGSFAAGYRREESLSGCSRRNALQNALHSAPSPSSSACSVGAAGPNFSDSRIGGCPTLFAHFAREVTLHSSESSQTWAGTASRRLGWSSFLQWATGREGRVEVEYPSAALRRERMEMPLRVGKIPSCRSQVGSDKDGATRISGCGPPDHGQGYRRGFLSLLARIPYERG